MVHKNDPEFCFREERKRQHFQVLYSRQTRERQIFMEDLRDYRRRLEKKTFRNIIEMVGPKWYQVLSVPQRQALDTLDECIHQDILEGRPYRTAAVMKRLGLHPRPDESDLMNCIYMGRHDSKVMLAYLYLDTYGYSFESKQLSYCLKAKLILSALFYLGLKNLLELLKQRFHVEPKTEPLPPRIKPKKSEPLESPYLQKLKAALYLRPKKPKHKPAPLPDLDDLNEPVEEEPVIPKPPPPPPPPPKPKKRLPRSYCDKLAGIIPMGRMTPENASIKSGKRIIVKAKRNSKLSVTTSDFTRKTYGVGAGVNTKVRRKKPTAPSTGVWNTQYMINGVYTIQGKTVYVLANVTTLPSAGDLIHGGHAFVNGQYVNIHCGFRAPPPPSESDGCDCVKKYHHVVFQYIKSTKCYCGHHYDYGNEGIFQSDELPFFEKPTRHMPYQINYDNIYDLDERQLHIKKEFKKLWDTDSVLQEKGAIDHKKDKKKKKVKRASTTCLGDKPNPEDYLKCALRHMRHINIAAKLPDVHLVPELKEWMRKRIYGPLTYYEKAGMIRRSNYYWTFFDTISKRGFGHVSPPYNPHFSGETTWLEKFDLNKKFRKFAISYKSKVFMTHAFANNLFWTTMFQAEFPDKKFREIYFCYLCPRAEDMSLMHPYSTRETAERTVKLMNNRYCCLPAGIDPQEI